MTRGGAIESCHLGVAVVVEPGGREIARAGDPAWPVVTRSSVKPFQALPLVVAGGLEAFGLDAADLALVCSSHSGTEEQAARAEAMLARAGLDRSALACGAHRPYDESTAAALDAAGRSPSALHNNCSGKHAGMLLGCRHAGLPLDGYTGFDHPWQLRIQAALAACCGLPAEAARPCGIDGCSAPTFALPARALARGYAALAAPEAAGLEREVAAALGRIAAAMGRHPGMVAGPGRFTSALIAATGGRVLGKEGAEGVYGLAVRGPVALGAALKLADGGERARDTVVLELLSQLGALSAAEKSALAPFYRPRQRNHRGLEIGEIVAEIELEEA